ncbi:hypothetical protein ACMU_06285 [Actibacterium mucosum KCTC 23349]|uniref:Short-chain dehydrogenase n=1 Tax=Actibacterium mucosum KCTC 23349 TaxID=1454373 RepID=A0A037ZP05_9RHOB|nr:SDR family oxidoreductase [Actibacterium mucosum]KAJ56546.1 hypothetical protein ACMU_06285 [Actibacterium mucosum KCTC 23349]
MKRFLEGQVAVVTGASNGLGVATARFLAQAGAAVVVSARRADPLRALAAELNEWQLPAVPCTADLRSDQDIARLSQTALQAFGRIDIVMNIGGTADGIGRNLWDVSAREWDEIRAVNIDGPMSLVRHFLPVMLRQGGGRMLFLSSSATQRPVPRSGAYAASKMAVNGLVHSLPLEIGEVPIAFNAFNPGPVDTETHRDVMRGLQQTGPTVVRSAEMAAAMPLWLCAPHTYGMTGQFLHWRDEDIYAAVQGFAADVNLPNRR